MRNPSVNGTMSQFLDVKIVGIMTFDAHLLTNNLQFTNYWSTIYQGYSQVFQVGVSSQKLVGSL